MSHGLHNFAIIFYEALVEIGESQERLEFLLLGRYWPIEDAFDFDWIHTDAAFADDDAQILRFQDLKLALFGFKE